MRTYTRIVYEGIKAYNFYINATKTDKEHCFKLNGFGPEFANVGGWWLEKEGLWMAYDFTNGEEVFLEEFDNQTEAIKYASGVLARTKDGLKI